MSPTARRWRGQPLSALAVFLVLLVLLALVLGTACSRSERVRDRQQARPGGTATAAPTGPTAPEEVPKDSQRLYQTLDADLEAFRAALGPAAPPHRALTFGAELLIVNCNQGEALLEPILLDLARLQLDALRSMGVQGVTFCIHYPLLYKDFPQSDRFLRFYVQLVEEIRRRGLKIAIDTQVVFSGSPMARITADFSDLTIETYADRKAQMAQTIIDHLAPDYLSLGGEPDTEARLTGLRALNDPAQHADFLRKVLAKLDRKRTRVGAGSGTWVSTEFARLYASTTSVDFIDMHIYPLGPNIIDNTLRMADIAREHGKGIVVYEAWLYKASRSEAGTNVAAAEEVFARDRYAFWQPLDEKFVANLVALANVKQFEYISPFWSTQFFAYVSADEAAGKPQQQVQRATNQRALENMRANRLTGTGERYRALIRANTSG